MCGRPKIDKPKEVWDKPPRSQYKCSVVLADWLSDSVNERAKGTSGDTLLLVFVPDNFHFADDWRWLLGREIGLSVFANLQCIHVKTFVAHMAAKVSVKFAVQPSLSTTRRVNDFDQAGDPRAKEIFKPSKPSVVRSLSKRIRCGLVWISVHTKRLNNVAFVRCRS
jgi:hypothetical protein